MNQERRKVMIHKTVLMRIYIRFFNPFRKCHVKILLEEFNARGGENIFKPRIGNKSLHQDSKDNGVGVVNFAASKNLFVKSAMFPHQNIHKYTWTSPDGKNHNHIDLILIGDGIRVY
jgi:hypothetical protein